MTLPHKVNISGNLRNRLLALLIIPMLSVSIFFSIEAYKNTRTIAKNSFDESLVILTLAIMGQAENFSGDSLPENTLDIINTTIGDVFFYHVTAPEGGFISGYSERPSHPDPINAKELSSGKPFLFDSVYKNIPVRVALFRQYSDNPDYTGWVELTIWQYLDKQHDFQRLLFIRAISRLAVLISLVTLILWFGIRYGLKPLSELQTAVNRRSINDLSPIENTVPFEVKSLVESMNDLFLRLKKAIEKREAFLGNASHQLKTPLARIRAQAELALREKDNDKRINDIREVVQLTRHSSRLTNQMLSLLRAESEELLSKQHQTIEINQLTQDVAEHYALDIVRAKRELIFEPHDDPLHVLALPIMLTEAISNLVENSMAYSHENTEITIRIKKNNSYAEIWVIDQGPGITKEKQEQATHRFYRVPGTKATGCGLGLAIVSEIVKSFSGILFFDGPNDNNFSIGIRLPLQEKMNT